MKLQDTSEGQLNAYATSGTSPAPRSVEIPFSLPADSYDASARRQLIRDNLVKLHPDHPPVERRKKLRMQVENAFEDSGSSPPLVHNIYQSEVKASKELGFIDPLPKAPPEDTPSRYHCSPEWHLRRLRRTPLAGLLYSFALRVSKKNRLFHGSVVGVAEYFEISRSTAQRAIAALVKLGFFELVAREAFQPTVYRPISHKEWAAKHPGRCAVKESFPWSGEDGDKLGVRLWNASGGKVKYLPYQLTALRNTGLADDEILAAFRTFVTSEQAQRKASGRNGRWSKVPACFLRWLMDRHNRTN